MKKQDLIDLLIHKLANLERAKYKGEFGLPDDEDCAEYCYIDGYTDALRYVLIHLGVNKIKQNVNGRR